MRFDFTKTEFDYFIERCGFTDEELKVLELKRRGLTNITIAADMYVCERTVLRRVKSIKKKIIKVINETP